MVPIELEMLALYKWGNGISSKLDRYIPELLTRGQLEVASQRPPPRYVIFALFELRDKYFSIEALDELPLVLRASTTRPFVIFEIGHPLFQSVRTDAQNQALNALVFLYGRVLGIELGDFSDFARSKRPTRLPAVLTRDECSQLFSKMEKTQHLAALVDQFQFRVGDEESV